MKDIFDGVLKLADPKCHLGYLPYVGSFVHVWFQHVSWTQSRRMRVMWEERETDKGGKD